MSLKETKSSTGNFVNCVTFWLNILLKRTDTEIHSINKTNMFVGFSVKNTYALACDPVMFLSIHEMLYSNKMYQCEYVGKWLGSLSKNEITESFLKEL